MDTPINRILRCITVVFLAVIMVISFPLVTYATTGSNNAIDLTKLTSPVAGLQVGYSWSNNSWSGQGSGSVVANASDAGGTIVANTKGYNILGNKGASTMYITFTNTNASARTLSYKMTFSGNQITVPNYSTLNDANTPYVFELEGNSAITITIVTGQNSTQNTATFSEISLINANAVSVKYVAPKDQSGSTVLGTYTLNGSSVLDQTVDFGAETISGFAVKPITGYKHIGWKTESGSDIGNVNDLTTISKPDGTDDTNGDGVVEVYPFLVPTSAATYRVDNKDYYYWQDAMTAAVAGSSKLVIVVADGTLPGGTANNWVADTSDGNTANDYAVANSDGTVTYYVPAGIKFLVPYSVGDDGAFGGGDKYTDKATTDPAVYRTLTVASGAHIICNGEMNVNGQRYEYTQPHSGRAAGGHGLMKLEGSGTQLTVNGKLYCYGFIAGSGQVVVNGTMHELLQMAAWNGGSFSTEWYGEADNNTILFLSSYYVQNVEAPLRVNAGANVYAETVITGDVPVLGELSVRKSCAYIMPYTSSEGLFLLDTGTYITRTYDPTTDRVAYTLGKDSGDGNVKFGSIIISAGIPNIMNITLNSASYVLPVTSAMDVTFDTGVVLSFTNKVAVLPGGKVIIADGAKVNLSNTMYLFDLSDWTKTMSYPTSQAFVPQYYTIARKTTKKLTVTESAYLEVNGDLNIASGGGIYTTNGLFGKDADGNEVLGAASTSADKIIYGTGTITHAAAQANPYVISTNTSGVTLKAGYDSTLHRINLTHSVGHLAGYTGIVDESPYHAFAFAANKPFYGLGKDYNHYWYQHVIMVKGGVEGVIPHGSSIGETGGYASGIRSITTGGEQTNSNVVGYAVDGGTFTFTVDDDVCKVLVDDQEVAPTNGVYTISNITADHTITLVEHTPGDEATCTTDQICTVCQKVLVEALGHNAVTDAKVEPTCTETGLTEGSHCDRCNEALVAQEVISALGHTEVIDAAVAPTCTEAGLTEGKHCDRCGEVLIAQTPVDPLGYTHDWNAGECSRCDAQFKFRIVNMAVKDGLDMLFYIKKSDVKGLEDQFICRFSKEFADGRGTVTIDVEDWESYDETYYRYRFSDISAKEMMDKITGQICFTDTGNPASYPYSETVFDHIHDLYVNDPKNGKLATVLADLLNYGASCQILFEYDVTNLANQNANEALMANATQTDPASEFGLTKGKYLYGTSFSAKNKLMFTFYFDFGLTTAEDSKPTTDPNQFTVKITYQNSRKENVVKTFGSDAWFLRKQGDKVLYGIDVEGITLTAGRTPITCELIAADGTTFMSADSIPSYAHRTTEGTALYNTMQALLKSIDSADAYFD